MTDGYALELNDDELARYRLMAAIAASDEGDDWAAAGLRPGARVADVGCGPGAILEMLASIVGPAGTAVGVDADPVAVAHAAAAVAPLAQASATVGAADQTGLAPGSFDVVMCRHVLAHNGPIESSIVEHLAALVTPGGSVYLLDVDGAGLAIYPLDADLDVAERYRQFHAARGNDLRVGTRLGTLLEDAGLEVETYRSAARVMRVPPGMRGPQWAARDAMVAAGVATPDDLVRWDAAYDRMDRSARRPWMFMPIYLAIGRRPGR
jgi:SAM-dependent methyltransferase